MHTFFLPWAKQQSQIHPCKKEQENKHEWQENVRNKSYKVIKMSPLVRRNRRGSTARVRRQWQRKERSRGGLSQFVVQQVFAEADTADIDHIDKIDWG